MVPAENGRTVRKENWQAMKIGNRVAVLVPCHNEAATVGKVVDDFRKALPEATVYVYDNNSTDDTAARAREAGAEVRKEPRQGKGNVLRTMFREIDADCYVLTDGDDTYPAEAAPEMVRLVLEERADMVVGDRLSSTYAQENKRRFHGFGNELVRRLVNGVFHGEVSDIMTGYRAFGRGFAKTFPVLSKGFEIETEMTIHALDKNLLVRSVPVAYRDRPAGSQSKLRTIPDGIRVLWTIATLFKNYRPLFFFSLVGAVFLAGSAALAVPVLAEYARTGLVPRFPSLIVSGVFLTLAILFWITGLMLDTINQKHRQLFELHLTALMGTSRQDGAPPPAREGP